jgi:16S rRNA (cytidine1402-2'-O)-methyltransferase
MSGTLYVVATPIGNLEDITLRALRVLREADIIAAEDTRRTARLLRHHGISSPTTSFHEHNARSRSAQLIGRLEAGQRVAVVTDAGTPGVSDPGLELVTLAIERGIRVEPIPGPSAPLAALVASGFPVMPFTMFGFAPARSKDRHEWLRSIAVTTHTFSFFETPHRIRDTLADAAVVFGVRPIIVARELTKVHEEFLRGTAAQVLERLSTPRGEYTIVVGPADNCHELNAITTSDHDVVAEFWHLTNIGRSSRREIVKELARKSGRSSKEIYTAIERGKNSPE